MRVLVTGATGFVGPYVVRLIKGSGHEVISTASVDSDHATLGSVSQLDVTDASMTEEVIRKAQPSHVLHLAGIASPNEVRDNPARAWRVNLDGTLHVCRAILRHCPSCRLLYVSSALLYGNSALSGPIHEDAALAPIDEYGATKAAADLAVGALCNSGLRAIRVRPFNHTGPGQSMAFAIPAFAMQIAQIEKSKADPVIRVGNLEAERDYLDVRDVAAGYKLMLENFDRAKSGSVFNIASGIPRRMSDILRALLAMARTEIRIERDESRMRPSDVPTLVGHAEKARKTFNWAPTLNFDQTLNDVLTTCRNLA